MSMIYSGATYPNTGLVPYMLIPTQYCHIQGGWPDHHHCGVHSQDGPT